MPSLGPMGLLGKKKAEAPAAPPAAPPPPPPSAPTPANWTRSAIATTGGVPIDDPKDLVARAARELPPLDFGVDTAASIPIAFDVGGFSATVGGGEDGNGAWEISADELFALRRELDERRLESARLREEVQLERVKVEQLTARLAASQLDEARSYSEYERERKRAELYYAELQRCYEVLCERGIPVPS